MLSRSIFDGTLASRTVCAFQFSFETLAERNRKLYFWTFTPEYKVRDELYSVWWHRFLVRLKRHVFPIDFEGLRVYERWDDGFLHSHMVGNSRLPVQEVCAEAEKAGIGWMHVSKVTDNKSAALYCSKYLTKQFRHKGSGVRHWAAIGDWPYCRVRDVKTSSNPPSCLSYFMARAREEGQSVGKAYFTALNQQKLVDAGLIDDPLAGDIPYTAEDTV